VESLKEGGRTAASGAGPTRAGNALVVAEIALRFLLVSPAALLVRSFYSLEQDDQGIDSTNVVTM